MHRSWTIVYIIVPAMMLLHSLYQKIPARVAAFISALSCAAVAYAGYTAGFVWMDKFNPWSFPAQLVMGINGFAGICFLLMTIDAEWR